jgi:hypothetical protein
MVLPLFRFFCCWLLVLAFATTGLWAQTHALEVRVRAAEDRTPLEFVNVLIAPYLGDDPSLQDATNFANLPRNLGGSTDAEGQYTLRLPEGRYEVVSAYIGYRNDTTVVNLNRFRVLEIDLVSSTSLLETVTVSGRDARTNIEQTQMGVERLSAKQLELLPAALGEADVLRGLTMLPGVTAAGEASNGLSIRGGSLDQNLVLLDHAPIFNPTHLFGLFSIFTPEAVAAVDLFRANVPARYGGRISSVVDVSLKNPSAEQFTMSGGIGLASSRISVETPLVKNKLHALAAVRAGFNDFWFALVDRLDNTRANFADATLKLKYELNERNRLTATGFYATDFYEVDLISQFNAINASSNQYDYYTLNGTLDWLRTLPGGAYLQTVLVSSDYQPRILFPERGVDNTVTYESRIKYQSIRSQLSLPQQGNWTTSFGLQGNRYRNEPGRLLPGASTAVANRELPAETSLELAAYAEGEWTPTDIFTATVGLRYVHYLLLGPETLRTYDPNLPRTPEAVVGTETFATGEVVSQYGGLEPRLGLRLKLGEQTALKGSYARSKQYVQNIFNSATPLPTSRWKTSNEHIRPQASNLVSLGIYRNLRAGMYELGLEGYYRETENVLEYKPGADFFLEPFVETEVLQGQGQAYGLEFSVNKRQGKLNGWLNYTYSRSLNRMQGDFFSERINGGDWYPGNFDRPHSINATLNIIGSENNTISFNFALQTGRPFTVANGFLDVDGQAIPLFLERNNDRLPTYHRLDFSWHITNPSQKKRRWRGDWTFTVYNIYGRRNAYNVYYGPRPGNLGNVFGSSPLGAYRLSIFGSPVVSLTYNFKFS